VPLPLTDLKPSARRTLYALRQAGQKGATTGELCQPDVGGIRFGARVQELRDMGCVVYRVQLRPGRWRYWLTVDAFEAQMPRRPVIEDEAQIEIGEAA
jgi:hypothetical protein